MTRPILVLLILLLPRWAGAEILRIEDAVRLALDNNERSRKAPLRVEIAEAQLDRARDAFFPTLVASGSSTLVPDAKGPNPAMAGALQLTQPLLSPSAYPLYSQQRHNRQAEKWGSEEDRRQLAFDTARAFIQVLTAEGVLASAKRKVDSANVNLAAAKARAQAQLNSTNDVTKAELQLATSQGQLDDAEGNVKRAYLALSFLVGRPIEGPLAPPDQTTKAARHFETARNNQVQDALARRERATAAAEARRPDIHSLHEKNLALEASADEPLYRLIPTLSASGQVRLTVDPLPTQRMLDEQASLNLTWQLFDAGVRYSDRRQRLAQLESSKLDEHLLRRSVRSDIDSAIATLHAARGSYEASLMAATAAQKNLDETTILYQQGLAIALEVNDASDKLFDAEVSRESAKLSMELAYLDLRNALGFGPIDQREGR